MLSREKVSCKDRDVGLPPLDRLPVECKDVSERTGTGGLSWIKQRKEEKRERR